MPPPRRNKHLATVFGFTLAEVFSSHPNRQRNTAFTLAEVLITLGIIGIVAAITMPTLITNYKKKQTATQLKASYSILGQAIQYSISENGDLKTWDFDTIDYNREKFMEKYILPYLKVVKQDKNRAWKVYSINLSSTGAYDWGWGPRYLLTNGNTIQLISFKSGTFIWVDINSQKGPNVLGKDVFVFQLVAIGSSSSKKYGLVPYGYKLSRDELLGKTGSSESACSKEVGSDRYGGEYCAAVIMQDSWEIKDDYPW